MVASNAINATTSGLVKFTGTAFTAETTTNHNLLIGAASNGITSVAPSATSGIPVISQGAAVDPAFGTAVVAGGGTGAVTLTGVLIGNGTSAVTGNAVTNHAVLVGGASNAITNLTAGTNGQVLLGSTGADPVFATLTGTGGITFTTGAGSLVVNSTGGGLTWSTVTGDTSFTVNTGTVANKSGLLTMTLPASAAVGDIIEITGINTALGWKIAQNANQQIFFLSQSTTLGVSGSLASSSTRDSVKLVCVVSGSSTVYNVTSAVGNITVV